MKNNAATSSKDWYIKKSFLLQCWDYKCDYRRDIFAKVITYWDRLKEKPEIFPGCWVYNEIVGKVVKENQGSSLLQKGCENMTFYLFCLLVVTICFQFSSPLPDGGRFRRHADGLFTSELSKIKNDIAMKDYLRRLLGSKRSISELNFPKASKELEAKFEEACFNWLSQNVVIESLSENDALEIYKLMCRPLCNLIVSVKEFIPLDKLLGMAE